MSAMVRRPSPFLESFGAPSREGPNPSPWKRFSLMGKVQEWLLEDMFNVSGWLLRFPPSPPPSGRPTENVSCLFHAESGKKKTAGSFILTPNRTKHEQDVLCLHPGSSLSQGSGSKAPTLFKNVAYFCHQALAAAPWGRAGGVPSKADCEFSIQ